MSKEGHCGCASCSAQKSHSHEGSQGCGCGCSSCKCDCHKAITQCKYADSLLHLADEAWMEVVKAKIKEHILANSNEHITALANLVSSTNHKRWADKMCEKGTLSNFEDKLGELLHGQCKK